jgi:hypothetical protein
VGRSIAPPEGLEVGGLPEPRHGKYDWAAWAEFARKHSPKWVPVFEHDKLSLVNQIRNGDVRALRKEKGFEVTTRHNQKVNVNGRVRPYCAMWLRYVPDNDTERSND